MSPSFNATTSSISVSLCLLGGLTLTEKIPAESLNKLFSQTVMFYFSMQRGGTANAFLTFLNYNGGQKMNFDGALKQNYRGLDDARKEVIAKRKK